VLCRDHAVLQRNINISDEKSVSTFGKEKVASSSETSVLTYLTTWRHNPEDSQEKEEQAIVVTNFLQ
jgi:hypothetical protein